MVLERKIVSSPRGFKGLSNPSRVHARLICLSLPVLGMDKGLAPFVSFHTLNGRRVLPQIMLPPKYLLEWLRAFLVAVGQGRDHSPDTKRTAEPLHH